VRYYNAWVEHITDKEKIEELDFEPSYDDEEEPEDEQSLFKSSLAEALMDDSSGRHRQRSRFVSMDIP